MEFHLQLDPIPFERKITVNDAVMLLGSCFTEHIYERLYRFKFNVQQNPNGILFNPKSIAQSIGDYISKRELNESEFFFQNGIWNHWQFHSSLSNGDLNIANNIMNEKIQHAHEFLAKTNWLIITFGSAILYDLDNGQTVANCHKSPSNIFNRRMLSIDEIIKIYSNTIESLLTFNPTINLIFTVSPVRHLKEGFVENNRSKSRLIIAIEKLTEMFDCCHYFPSMQKTWFTQITLLQIMFGKNFPLLVLMENLAKFSRSYSLYIMLLCIGQCIRRVKNIKNLRQKPINQL
jgi:hypothetical protein